MRPDLTFFMSGTFPASIHMGSLAQGSPIGPVNRSTKDLVLVRTMEEQGDVEGKEFERLQDRIADEQHQYPDCYDTKSGDIG
jgi:hypothetical protein